MRFDGARSGTMRILAKFSNVPYSTSNFEAHFRTKLRLAKKWWSISALCWRLCAICLTCVTSHHSLLSPTSMPLLPSPWGSISFRSWKRTSCELRWYPPMSSYFPCMVAAVKVGKPGLYEEFADDFDETEDGFVDRRSAKPCHWLSMVTFRQWICAGLVLILILLFALFLCWKFILSRFTILSTVDGLRWTLNEMTTHGRTFQCGPVAGTICLKSSLEVTVVNPSATRLTIGPSPTDLYYNGSYLGQIDIPLLMIRDGGQEIIRFTTNLGGLVNETYNALRRSVVERKESASVSPSVSPSAPPLTISAKTTADMSSYWSTTFTLPMQYALPIQNVSRVTLLPLSSSWSSIIIPSVVPASTTTRPTPRTTEELVIRPATRVNTTSSLWEPLILLLTIFARIYFIINTSFCCSSTPVGKNRIVESSERQKKYEQYRFLLEVLF